LKKVLVDYGLGGVVRDSDGARICFLFYVPIPKGFLNFGSCFAC